MNNLANLNNSTVEYVKNINETDQKILIEDVEKNFRQALCDNLIKKVYLVLFAQLFISYFLLFLIAYKYVAIFTIRFLNCAFIHLTFFILFKFTSGKLLFGSNGFLLLFVIFVLIGTFCLMINYDSLRKRSPFNYLLSSISTVSIIIFISHFGSIVELKTVMISIFFSTLSVIGLSIFAFKTRFDL